MNLSWIPLSKTTIPPVSGLPEGFQDFLNGPKDGNESR
jgi:hypothetical protein